MSPDYDGTGYVHRTAVTSGESEIRALLDVALSDAFITTERGHTDDASFRPNLTRATDAARRHGLRAEQFVLIVKHAWAEQWRTHVLSRQQASFALERVVTVCIQEFYRCDDDEPLESGHERRRRPFDEAEA